MDRESANAGFEHLLQQLAPQVLGSVMRRFRDFAATEDAVQEALLAAASQWPNEGIPSNPLGWLIQVAVRRMTDHIRSDSARRRREAQLALEPNTAGYTMPLLEDPAQDDTLTLVFMCCHPSLTPSSAIALTLRAVGGLTTAAIASAFLVPEATMAQRISRAKQTIRASGVPFEMPSAAERAERLRAVLHVLYLIFNEGYTTSAGSQLQRIDLSDEAIRLARLISASLPGDPEVTGLLSLMLLTDARKKARTGASGELIPLDEQDRSLWDKAQISEGIDLLTKALAVGSIGPYQLQAAIAAVHDEAQSAETTDWPQILALYELLKRISPNPMVALNHAVAFAMVRGPEAALALLDDLNSDARIAGHYRLTAVRAHLLAMKGDTASAMEHYRQAASLTASQPERDYLLRKATRLTGPTSR